MNKYNPTIEIIDNSKTCAEALDEFYEDKLFKYYFTCMKSNDVYAVINDDKMYLVKDLLNNNPTEYSIRIDKILDRLDFYGVNYLKENKYGFIPFEIDVPMHNENVIAYPLEIANVEDKEILDVEFNYNNSEMTANRKYTIDLHLIPKQFGKTNLTVEFIDGETDEVINTYNYSIKIDEDLNVNFKEIK